MPEEAREAMHTVDGHGQRPLQAVGGIYAPLLGLRLEEVQRDSLEQPLGAAIADPIISQMINSEGLIALLGSELINFAAARRQS